MLDDYKVLVCKHFGKCIFGVVFLFVVCVGLASYVSYDSGYWAGSGDSDSIDFERVQALLEHGVITSDIIYGSQNVFRVPMSGLDLLGGNASFTLDDERHYDRIVIRNVDMDDAVKTYCTVLYPAMSLGKSVCFFNDYYRSFEFDNNLSVCQDTWDGLAGALDRWVV